jgi:hypothetical protein
VTLSPPRSAHREAAAFEHPPERDHFGLLAADDLYGQRFDCRAAARYFLT